MIINNPHAGKEVTITDTEYSLKYSLVQLTEIYLKEYKTNFDYPTFSPAEVEGDQD